MSTPLTLHHLSHCLAARELAPELATQRWFGGEIDSRKISKNKLFFALRGKRTDGHQHIKEAFDRGAIAAIAEYRPDNLSPCYPLILVPNVIQAMGFVSKLKREANLGMPIIAITGSNGKTTIKNMISSILNQQIPTAASSGNMNNEIGLALTMINLQEAHQMAVLEMGARRPGDIQYLCNISAPNLTLISNIGKSHLGVFGTQAQLKQSKQEILNYGEFSILNKNSPHYKDFSEICLRANKKTMSIQQHQKGSADQSAFIQWRWQNGISIFETKQGEIRCRMRCLGAHNTFNAAYAVAVAHHYGINNEQIRQALTCLEPETGRMQTIKQGNLTIINDSYNASPESLEALLVAITHLKDAKKTTKILVFADMLELGDQSEEYHRKAGELIKQSPIDYLFTLGDLSQLAGTEMPSDRWEHHHDIETLSQAINRDLKNQTQSEKTHLFLKGSNLMSLSSIIQKL